ncbi:GAF domain-containing sensor histidine kinase [Malaciobacter marinus]|jgi:signal transduction histidine kinase|uniref:histidine kinase n=1 Tax=Malaciobacter marinus TaxID=505249 RepID=A0AB36ZW97_9BACT|nr:GAF domain-containing sensor histidine kinase [Malaciobacter marinus]PPK60852.1 signal transduction histidine kinase [Malaciobacter marinus]
MDKELKHFYDLSIFTIEDLDVLLHEILKHTRELVSCEAGSIYMKEKDHLAFHVFQNDALTYENIFKQYCNIKDLKLPLNDSRKYLAVESLQLNKIIIIDNAYKTTDYELLGVKEFDEIFDYKTYSIITVPLIHPREKTKLGVIQLLNKKSDKKIDVFTKKDKDIVSMISSFISLSIAKAQNDVQKLKRLNKQLEEANKKLESRVEKEVKENEKMSAIIFHQSKMASMGEMIGNIAHQWRQPLSSISTIASGMSLDLEMKNFEKDKGITQLKQIVDTTKYLSQTIDDFRSFYKVDRAKEHFNLADAVQKSVSLSIATMSSSYIKFVLNLDEELTAYGLRNEFTQSLLNLLTNAKDALVENVSVEEKRYIFIDIYKKNNKNILQIKDNAKGIPTKLLDKIFLQHFTTKSKIGGTGIGLFMVKEIIEKHMDATISVSNEEFTFNDKNYKGACFTITF